MVSDTFQGGCVCENAAGLRHGTDNVEFAAMCAPRPMFLVGATGDWTKLTMERAYPAIRGVYSLVGSTDRVGAQVFDFPHNYNQTTRNAVYAAMGRWLLGIDEPEKTREGKQQPEKPEDLLTFDSVHPAPATEDPRAARGLPDRDPPQAARGDRSCGRPVAMGGRPPTAPDRIEGPDRRRQPRPGVARFPGGPPGPARGLPGDPHPAGPSVVRRGDPGRSADPRKSLGKAHGHRPSEGEGRAGGRRGRAIRAGAVADGRRT